MPNQKEIYLLLYCRVGSKKLLSFDRSFFKRIEWLVDDIEYTPTDTGLVACIKSRVDMDMMHLQLMDHSDGNKRSRPIMLIDLKSGSAKGNLKTLSKKPKNREEFEQYKFDAFIGRRGGLNLSPETDEEFDTIGEDTINDILDEINRHGIEALDKRKLKVLKAYSKHLRSRNE